MTQASFLAQWKLSLSLLCLLLSACSETISHTSQTASSNDKNQAVRSETLADTITTPEKDDGTAIAPTNVAGTFLRVACGMAEETADGIRYGCASYDESGTRMERTREVTYSAMVVCDDDTNDCETDSWTEVAFSTVSKGSEWDMWDVMTDPIPGSTRRAIRAKVIHDEKPLVVETEISSTTRSRWGQDVCFNHKGQLGIAENGICWQLGPVKKDCNYVCKDQGVHEDTWKLGSDEFDVNACVELISKIATVEITQRATDSAKSAGCSYSSKRNIVIKHDDFDPDTQSADLQLVCGCKLPERDSLANNDRFEGN